MLEIDKNPTFLDLGVDDDVALFERAAILRLKDNGLEPIP